MHSSRMRTGRSLTVCRSLLPVGCLVLRGVSARGGVWSLGCLLLGGVWSWGVSAPKGGCLLLGGGGGLLRGVVSQHALRQTPPCEQNHRHL